VLEHSLRCVLYSDKSIRLASLLHDIGKPFCFRRDGYYYHHFEEGEKIAERVLKRLRADNDTIKKVKFLVKEHMVDLDCSMKENKVRRFIVKNREMLNALLLVKQADFRASLEIDERAPTLIKWGRIIDKMNKDGTPFTLKELKISSGDLMEMGYVGQNIGKELNKLWDFAVLNPHDNERERLLKVARKDLATIK
jgi:tRNA nucleotidyltransferase (CCA-adding enzyme)